jgi:phosphoribosylamine--glycine ligase
METIFRPTIAAMNKEGRPFKGVIYFGLMLTPDGPRVVEYNARFGDPETQPILSMLETDLLDIFERSWTRNWTRWTSAGRAAPPVAW